MKKKNNFELQLGINRCFNFEELFQNFLFTMVQPKILSCIRFCAQKKSTKVECTWGMCSLCTKYSDGLLFTGLQSVCVWKFLTFLLCIIIESIAADFYKDSCCVSLHNWGLSITCDFAFSIVLLPWRTLVLMEKEWKALSSPRYLYIFIIYFSCVLCATNFFQFITNTIW